MFSGIIKDVGEVVDLINLEDRSVLLIKSSMFLKNEIEIGESICISGVCLTVIKQEEDVCSFDLATETRRCTTLGNLKKKDLVNLERSISGSQLVHGHFVQGHVDTKTEVLDIIKEENTVEFYFKKPSVISDLIVEKGSISINGVSLTVGKVKEDRFSVYIIPHTLKVTNFCKLKSGSLVNLESDCLARYVRGIIKNYKK